MSSCTLKSVKDGALSYTTFLKLAKFRSRNEESLNESHLWIWPEIYACKPTRFPSIKSKNACKYYALQRATSSEVRQHPDATERETQIKVCMEMACKIYEIACKDTHMRICMYVFENSFHA